MSIYLKIILALFLLLNSLNTYSENLDSLIKNISSPKSDSAQHALFAQIANAYSDSNYTKSLEYWLLALEQAEKSNNRLLVADSYHQIGYSYQKMGEFTNALKYLNDASNIYEFLKEKKSYAGVLNDIGLIYRNWGKYDDALDYYLQALKIFDEILDVEGAAMISNSIGQIYYYRENFAKAIEYFIRYYEVNLGLKNYRSVAGAANNIASAYLEIKKFDDALQYYLKALNIYDSLSIKIGVAIIRDNIGSLFFQKQQFDDALLYHNSALGIFKELNSPVRISSTLKNIGMVYLKQERFESAISKLNESLTIAKQTGQKESIKDVYEVLSEAYYNNGNYKQAYEYQKSFDTIKDSILNAESIEKIETLQAEYETEKRESEIKSINHQLEIQRKILYAFLGFVTILVALTLLLLKENQAKKRAITNTETLRAKILELLSTACNNINIIGNDRPIGNHFSESWQIAPSFDGFPKVYMQHFKIGKIIFAYFLIIKDSTVSPELINLTLYNYVSGIINNKPEQLTILNKLIASQLQNDPLTSTYNNDHYQILPLLIDGDRILTFSNEHYAYVQKRTLITLNENVWISLKKDDIIYIYTSFSDIQLMDDRKAVRKIFKNLIEIEFSEQQNITLNYLKSIEMDDSVIIFALKV